MKKILTHAFLILMSVITVYPLIWTIVSSLKPKNEFFDNQLSLVGFTPTLENYIRVWGKASFGTYFLNSVLVTICTVALVVVMTNLAGYALGRYRFVGSKLLMAIFLSSICIPLVST